MPRRATPLLAMGCAAIGFVVALSFQARRADPAARVPTRFRLADLIEAEQRRTAGLRREVSTLRQEVDGLRTAGAGRRAGHAVLESRLASVSEVAGLVAVRGPGLRVTLDDSTREEAPSGNINDLVIHSQDVQAVVNALWRSGAEAVGINGQRLVATSAVLCVGNTLLLNGTVHSPPYVISAIGASRDRFEADRLVRRLHVSADRFGLRFSVERQADLEVPSYRGSTKPSYARPAGA